MPNQLYPLAMRFPTSAGPIDVLIDRGNWSFLTLDYDERRYSSLPVAERLDLRRAFWAQVDLANQTPKGD